MDEMHMISEDTHDFLIFSALSAVIVGSLAAFPDLEKDRAKALRFVFSRKKREEINKEYNDARNHLFQTAAKTFKSLYLKALEQYMGQYTQFLETQTKSGEKPLLH